MQQDKYMNSLHETHSTYSIRGKESNPLLNPVRSSLRIF